MLEIIVIISLLSTFFLLLITKLGVREIMQQRGFKLLSVMANCDFCISFWTNVLICSLAMIIFQDISFLVYPIFATPITRFLI